MRQISAREANQNFAKVLASVESGETVVIAKRGKRVAVIRPYPGELSTERQAAIDTLEQLLEAPLVPAEGFRTFSRDEMHDRS